MGATTILRCENGVVARQSSLAWTRRRSIASIAYGACYAYSPRGIGTVSECSRVLCTGLKMADAGSLARFAARVREQVIERRQFGWFFGQGVILVPVPASAPAGGGMPWVSAQLATCLCQAGLAEAAWEGLRRVHAVRKSATSPAGERPSVQEHYDSFAIEEPGSTGRSDALALDRIVLVDDVITKGRTLFAAAMRLHEVLPRSQIRAFALFRTLGRIERIERLLDPCQGEIRWVRQDAQRQP